MSIKGCSPQNSAVTTLQESSKALATFNQDQIIHHNTLTKIKKLSVYSTTCAKIFTEDNIQRFVMLDSSNMPSFHSLVDFKAYLNNVYWKVTQYSNNQEYKLTPCLKGLFGGGNDMSKPSSGTTSPTGVQRLRPPPSEVNSKVIEAHRPYIFTGDLENVFNECYGEFQKGREQGRIRTALCYLFGMGTPIDYLQAFNLTMNSKDSFSLWIQGTCFNVGFLDKGKWIQDKRKACELFEKSYNQDSNVHAAWALIWQRKFGDQGSIAYKYCSSVFENLAQLGDVISQYTLGCDERNDSRTQYLKRAGERGFPLAQYERAREFCNKEKSEKMDSLNKQKLIKWLENAYKMRVKNAPYSLYECYWYGYGVTVDQKKGLDWLKKGGEEGDTKCQYEVGKIFFYGSGSIQTDEQEGVKWFRKAAEQGDKDAQCELGSCYLMGRGVPRNEAEALVWLEKGTENGSRAYKVQITYCEGLLYLYGKVYQKNEEKGIALLKEAAAAGLGEAAFELNKCYIEGIGVPKDEKEALAYLEIAANKWHLLAQVNLGKCYLYGQGKDKDEKLAAHWLQLAANRNNPEAKSLLREYFYLEGEKFDPTIQWMVDAAKKFAQQGNAKAQYDLAMCYMKGKGGVESDLEEAISWLVKSSDQGYAEAQYFLASICMSLPENALQGNKEKYFISLIKKAADQGHIEAQTVLGQCLLEGVYGITKDKNEGIRLIRNSAEKGNPDAQYELGNCYISGNGVPLEKSEAIIWFKKAAEQGNNNSLNFLGYYYSMEMKDSKTAMQYYKKAAENGMADAQFALARLYIIEDTNIKDAIHWLKEAAKQNNKQAMEMLTQISITKEKI